MLVLAKLLLVQAVFRTPKPYIPWCSLSSNDSRLWINFNSFTSPKFNKPCFEARLEEQEAFNMKALDNICKSLKA